MSRTARIAPLAVLALLGACGFAHRPFDQAGGTLRTPDDFVIQVDDFGSFWDRDVAARALDAIAQSARGTNTIVVVVVHGWHHNAAPGDENAAGFARTLRDIRMKLAADAGGEPGTYRRSRQLLTGSGDVNVFGIYVGWRGTSLPSALNYLTFWDRKNAAERVGDGDLREFLHRLNDIYRTSYRNRSPSSPYVGMVSIGHSFGAQVLFKAVAGALERELIDVTRISPDRAAPARTLERPLEGFGDIVILLNPALEAFQYERIRKLDAQVSYDRRQPPLLLVLSADTDTSRRLFFPLGRWVEAIFNAPMSDEQSDLWSLALGEYEPQRTHTVECLPAGGVPAASLYIGDSPDRPCDVVNFDLTDTPTIGRVRLVPIAGRHHAYSPFLVANCSKELIEGHSGIFEQELRNFIFDYVGITRGKRLLLADPEMRRCPEPAAEPASPGAGPVNAGEAPAAP